MSDMPRCKLCGGEAETVGEHWVRCPTMSCALGSMLLGRDEWRRLHGGRNDSEHTDAMCDLAYATGVAAGWNAGMCGNTAQRDNLIARKDEALKVLKRGLHGGLSEEHRKALQELLPWKGLTDKEREALRAVVGEAGPTIDEYGRSVPMMKREEMGDGGEFPVDWKKLRDAIRALANDAGKGG